MGETGFCVVTVAVRGRVAVLSSGSDSRLDMGCPFSIQLSQFSCLALRAVFRAVVHHSKSSIIVWACVPSSVSPLSTSPPWKCAQRVATGMWTDERTGAIWTSSMVSRSCWTPRAHGAAPAYESSCLAVPLGINPVDRIFQHCRGAVVIFRGDENKPVRCGYCSGPAFDDLILVRRAAGHRRRYGLIKEGHRKIAKVEQPRFDSVAFLEVLKNPLCRLLRKPALARAADDYRDNGHVVVLCWLLFRVFLNRPERLQREMTGIFPGTAGSWFVVLIRFLSASFWKCIDDDIIYINRYDVEGWGKDAGKCNTHLGFMSG